MAPRIPKYNNWWEELFPSPEMSRNPDVRSGKRKKIVGPVHVNRWGPNKEAWGKIGRTVLGLPSQEEIEMATRIRNNRVNNTQYNTIQLNTAKPGDFTHTLETLEAENKSKLVTKARNDIQQNKLRTEEVPSNNIETKATVDKVTKIPKESNIIQSGRTQAQGKGSVAKSKALLADMRVQQTSSAVDKKGEPLPTKDVKPITKQQIDATKQSLDKYGSSEAITLTPNKDGTLALKFDTAKHDKIVASETPNKIASLPKAEQLRKVGMFDGTKAGFAKGMKTATAVASLLETVLTKKKQPSTAGKEGGGGNINQVAVAAGINPEEFYSMV